MNSLYRLSLSCILALGFATAQATPIITATKDDNTAPGVRKVVGNTITYTITVGNSGATDATSVLFTDPDPANTTFVSVNSTPLARNDSHSAIGNVQISIAAPGLLANDNDPDGVGPALTVSSSPATSANGGNVSVAANGSFTYNPAPGFTGVDTFSYTISDGEGNTDTATVTINVTGRIWFIDAAASAGGDGRLTTPFNSIAAFNSTAADVAGDNIFLYSGTYTTPPTLLTKERLIGQGATASLTAITGLPVPSGNVLLPATGGARPTIAVTSGTGITLGSGNTINGLNVTNSNGSGIAGSAVGTLTLADFDVTVTGGTALSLTTSGTVTATGADNDLQATNGIALNVANVTIGAGGLTFKRIASSGAASGIVLNATGNGFFTITGDGTTTRNASGGLIQNVTGTAISLTDVANVQLNHVSIDGAAADGVFGTLITDEDGAGGAPSFAFRHGSITNQGDAVGEHAFDFETLSAANVTGTFIVDNTLVQNFGAGAVSVTNNAGTLTGSVTNSLIDNNHDTIGETAIEFRATGTAIINSTVQNNFLTDVEGSGISILNEGNQVNDTNILNNRIERLGGPDSFPTSPGMNINVQPNASVNFDVQGNAVRHCGGDGFVLVAFGSTMGRIGGSGAGQGNTFANMRLGDGVRIDVGDSTDANPALTGKTYTVLVENNDLGVDNTGLPAPAPTVPANTPGLGDDGIQILHRNTDNTLNLTILNNRINGTASEAVRFFTDEDTASIATPKNNVRIENNVLTNISPAIADDEIILVTQDTSTASYIITGNNNGTAGTFGTVVLNITAPSTASITQGSLAAMSTANDNCATTGSSTPTFNSGAGNPPLPTNPLLFSPGGVEGSTSVPRVVSGILPGTHGDKEPAIADATSSVIPATGGTSNLTQPELDALVAEALARWTASGLSGEQLATLRRLKFEVADLPGWYLGEAGGDRIRVDNNAGGHGWHVDASAEGDALFGTVVSPTRRYTDPAGTPAGRIDLLTTVLHEMGHALGLDDTYSEQDRDSLMYGFLTKGERRLPAKNQALGATPHAEAHPHFLGTPLTIGDLPPGKTVTITYVVNISSATPNVSNQGTVSGGNFASVLTDDPTVAGAANPTVTPVELPPTVSNVGKSANEDVATAFAAADFTPAGYSDPNGDPLTTVRITSLPANGLLKLSGSTFTVPQDIAIGSIGNLTYTSSLNYSGPDSFGWNGSDGTLFASSGALVNITVNPTNDEPTLDAIPNPVAILEDASQQTVNLSGISAGGGESQTLTVTATSGNPTLIPNPTVTYTSPNATGSVAYTPQADQFGTALITVTVMDNGGTANPGDDNVVTRQFTVMVTAVNDEPTLDPIANPPTIPVNSGQQTVNLSGISAGGGESQTLSVTATSGNPGLIPNPAVTYTSPNATGSLSYTPVAGQSGSALITVTVMDNGGGGTDTRERTFTVNVGAPNMSPTITGQNPVSTSQETARTIAFGDLIVSDPDNTYPTGFTLTVMDGVNYTRTGNTITPAVGFTGMLTVPVKVNDGGSDSNPFNLSVTVTPASGDPIAAKLFAKDEPVPGAGSPGGVPADALFSSFGIPAINDDDTTTIAFLAKYKSPTGSGAALFAGASTGVATIVKLGDTVPDAAGAAMAGVTFKTFKDPVLARDGSIVFIAKLAGIGVLTTNDFAVFTNAGGTLRMIAREGDTLPGTPVGSAVKAITSASLSSAGGDAWAVFTARLVVGPGGVTKDNDTGAWRWKASTGATAKIIGEGDTTALSAAAVKSFRLLRTSSGTPGQSRGQYAGANATFQVLFADKTQAIVDSDEVGLSAAFSSGAATVPGVAGALWKKFGAPAVPAIAGDGIAFLAQLESNVGGVIGADAKRLFFTPTTGTGASAKTTDIAPGLDGVAAFSAFKDPVLAPGGNVFGFLGAAKGGSVLKTDNTGIWWQSAGGSLALAAREGAQPPDTVAGAQWKSFSSVAASDKGPLFVAKLLIGPGGIDSTNDTGLWATTSGGSVRKHIQEGDTLDGSVVKSFTVLGAVSGSQGVRRAFAADGTVVLRVKFTDGGQAIYSVAVP